MSVAVTSRATPLLAFESVNKHFGGTAALSSVNMTIGQGEIVALLGQNGAGKSTLIKTLAGIYHPDGGRILYRGEPYTHRPGRFGEKQAVAFIHQDLGLIEWMSIAENIALALGFPTRGRLVNWKQVEKNASQALSLVGFHTDPRRRVDELSRSEKSLVAIARALMTEADILVLDEPTASLPTDEARLIFETLLDLKRQGVGMIYVSHRMDEIYAVADRVVVLRDGKLAGEAAIVDVTPEQLVTMIVGRLPTAVSSEYTHSDAKPLLSLEGFSATGVGPVTFTLHTGEVLGLVGLRGAGHERIGRALFGVLPHKGSARLRGKDLQLRSPREAMQQKMGLIARDRVTESVAIGLSVLENAFLNPVAAGRSFFQMQSRRTEAHRVREEGSKISLRPNNPYLPIEALSGGNQQKVVVSRWLAAGCDVLIAEDPTAGVDAGSKCDIHDLLVASARAGTSVLVVSTDFEEMESLCDRVLVFGQGKIVGELIGESLTVENMLHISSNELITT